MSSEAEKTILHDYAPTVSLVHYLTGSVLLLLGLALRLVAYNRIGFAWEAVRDVGSFLAVTMAVAFVYERLIQKREQRVFLNTLDDLLEAKMAGEQRGIRIFSQRPPLEEKLAVISHAKKEVAEVGTTLRTFVSYFQTRAQADYRDHVVRLLERGVNFKCVLMDPDWARERGLEEIATKGAASLTALRQIAAQFDLANYPGRFDILLYRHEPLFALIVVDGDESYGKLFFTPYLFKSPNVEAPAFLISRIHHPVLFSKFWERSGKAQIDSAIPARR